MKEPNSEIISPNALYGFARIFKRYAKWPFCLLGCLKECAAQPARKVFSSNSEFSTPRTAFRNVFIIVSRDWWRHALQNYDKQKDMVLTYDFGLQKEIEDLVGTVRYVDNLCDLSFMQKNNFLNPSKSRLTIKIYLIN